MRWYRSRLFKLALQQTDLQQPGPTKQRGGKLLKAVQGGEVSQATVDAQALRVLKLVQRAGKWEDPEEKPEFEAKSKVRDDLICDAAAEGFVLLKNEGSVLPFAKDKRVAVVGHHAATTNMSGGGSARIFPLGGITPLQGLEQAGFKPTYHPGVPVYNAIPLPSIDIVRPSVDQGSPAEPVQCEWYNSNAPDNNPVRSTSLKRPEYMIKEAWPNYLNEIGWCSRMTFRITPTTSGEHIIGVAATGEADVFVDGKLVCHKDQQMNMIFESCKSICVPLSRRTSSLLLPVVGCSAS